MLTESMYAKYLPQWKYTHGSMEEKIWNGGRSCWRSCGWGIVSTAKSSKDNSVFPLRAPGSVSGPPLPFVNEIPIILGGKQYLA